MARILVCLHGWGGSKESFDPLVTALKNTDITVYAPDLPGFGKEPEPPQEWTIDDYAAWTEQWIQTIIPEAHDGIFLLGHSHGGRIAIKMAVREHIPIDHLFLCAAAGIRHGRHLRRIFGLMLAKGGKNVFTFPGLRALEPLAKKILYKLVRVHDYERASEVMRKTMINVSREDLRSLLQNINPPTDIFWGTEDRMTPYSDAKIMEKEISGAILHTYPNVRHSVHKDRAEEIARIIQRRALAE